MSKLIEFIETDFSFEDSRGFLHQLCSKGYTQVNVSFSKSGVFRGGHFHKENIETFYILNGKAEIVLYNKLIEETIVVNAGDFFKIKPFIVHSFNFIEDTTMVVLYDKGVEIDYNTKDIYHGERECI